MTIWIQGPAGAAGGVGLIGDLEGVAETLAGIHGRQRAGGGDGRRRAAVAGDGDAEGSADGIGHLRAGLQTLDGRADRFEHVLAVEILGLAGGDGVLAAGLLGIQGGAEGGDGGGDLGDLAGVEPKVLPRVAISLAKLAAQAERSISLEGR